LTCRFSVPIAAERRNQKRTKGENTAHAVCIMINKPIDLSDERIAELLEIILDNAEGLNAKETEARGIIDALRIAELRAELAAQREAFGKLVEAAKNNLDKCTDLFIAMFSEDMRKEGPEVLKRLIHDLAHEMADSIKALSAALAAVERG
jgi:hypothetical protein